MFDKESFSGSGLESYGAKHNTETTTEQADNTRKIFETARQMTTKNYQEEQKGKQALDDDFTEIINNAWLGELQSNNFQNNNTANTGDLLAKNETKKEPDLGLSKKQEELKNVLSKPYNKEEFIKTLNSVFSGHEHLINNLISSQKDERLFKVFQLINNDYDNLNKNQILDTDIFEYMGVVYLESRFKITAGHESGAKGLGQITKYPPLDIAKNPFKYDYFFTKENINNLLEPFNKSNTLKVLNNEERELEISNEDYKKEKFALINEQKQLLQEIGEGNKISLRHFNTVFKPFFKLIFTNQLISVYGC